MAKKVTTLTAKQRKFCDNYTSLEYLGHGVQAYADAYGHGDVYADKKKYNICNQGSVRLLKDPLVIEQINKNLSLGGWNDATVDKNLLFLIEQFSDFHAKLGAIKEYNKVVGRITEKKQVTQEVTVKMDYSKLTDEELAQLELLAQKARESES